MARQARRSGLSRSRERISEMNKYYVEFQESGWMRVGLYLYAQSPKQVRDMLAEYDIIVLDQTD